MTGSEWSDGRRADAVAPDAVRSLLGIVLAGGDSLRFGSPKALARFDGAPLWRRAARALHGVGVPVVVLANDPTVAASVDLEVRPDVRPGQGPLAGIETGLIEARSRGRAGILLLACDLVLVEASMLRALVGDWSGEGVAAFDAPGPWGTEPLCAVWGVDLLPTVTAELDAGRSSPGALLGAIRCVSRPLRSVAPDADPERVFRSANRPEDLARLAPGPRSP